MSDVQWFGYRYRGDRVLIQDAHPEYNLRILPMDRFAVSSDSTELIHSNALSVNFSVDARLLKPLLRRSSGAQWSSFDLGSGGLDSFDVMRPTRHFKDGLHHARYFGLDLSRDVQPYGATLDVDKRKKALKQLYQVYAKSMRREPADLAGALRHACVFSDLSMDWASSLIDDKNHTLNCALLSVLTLNYAPFLYT